MLSAVKTITHEIFCKSGIKRFCLGFSTFDFRPSTIGLLLIFNFSFLTLHSCGLDIEDPTPPSPPVWVQKSLPEEWPERGIDAHESGGIYLEWEADQDDDIISFLIFRATWYDSPDSLGEFEVIDILRAETMNEFDYIDTRVDLDTKYFYRIQAKDISGVFSAYSDSIDYVKLRAVDYPTMFPNGVDAVMGNDRALNWRYHFRIVMEDYCITILSIKNEFIFRQTIQPNTYSNVYDSWEIPLNISLDSSKYYKWRLDANADYSDGIEHAGSESGWAIFQFDGE